MAASQGGDQIRLELNFPDVWPPSHSLSKVFPLEREGIKKPQSSVHTRRSFRIEVTIQGIAFVKQFSSSI